MGPREESVGVRGHHPPPWGRLVTAPPPAHHVEPPVDAVRCPRPDLLFLGGRCVRFVLLYIKTGVCAGCHAVSPAPPAAPVPCHLHAAPGWPALSTRARLEAVTHHRPSL